MPLTSIITGTQKRSKDSFASSPVVGLAVRANGEEKVKVIDSRGNVYLAGLQVPSVVPSIADDGVGLLPNNQWAAYVYVYASSRFGFVETDSAINGKLYPRGNPSPPRTYRYTGAGSRKILGTVTKTTQAGVDVIWIFRTAFFATEIEAQTAGEAGQAFFLTQVVNNGIAGTTTFTDNNPVAGVDQVQIDNFEAPQFQFTVFVDPYWWGFGNLPFAAEATWSNTHTGSTALLTLSGTDRWFDGRNGQNITLAAILSGGMDNAGTFRFLWLSATTATVTIDGITPVALPSAGSGKLIIQGPATTLYRSKPRNPFSWGFTEIIGDINVPQQYAFKVGGGMGTALAAVPNNATLKLDTEYPAKCYTLNLRSAGTSAFENTLRIISDVYSVSAHFSQFAAVTGDGQTVLWGLDYKNFAIVQSDGITQVPISGPIPKALRALTQDRTRQLLAHGAYDPRTELNCIWISTVASISLVNYLIYQHAPTGFWGFSNDQDVLCSASIQDTLTGGTKTFVGTQTGFLGQALVENVWGNWLPDVGAFTGTCNLATSNSITTAGADPAFNIVDDGMIGNWVMVTDANGQAEQMARISAVTAHTLTFDWIRPVIGNVLTAFNPVPVAGAKFYVGLIECRLLKYFDFNQPATSKQLLEIWLTQQGVDANTSNTLVRWYRERDNTYQQFAPLQMGYGIDANEPSDAWFAQETIPAELVKMFGLEVINRGYQQWRIASMVLKPRVNP